MSAVEDYLRAMRTFTQPYLAVMDAFTGLLTKSGGDATATTADPGNVAQSGSAGQAPRRAKALVAPRDAAKKELVTHVEPEPKPKPSSKPVIASAAVERANRAWVTRRANAAREEKAARAAARQKARSRKAR